MVALPISPALHGYDAVLLDLDGCLWVGDEPTPRAPEAVAALRAAGLPLAFITNESRHSVEDQVRKLWRLGFQASVQEVVTVGAAMQHVLASRGGGTAHVVGTQALVDHVADAGMRVVNRTEFASRADVVVVGGHDDLRYAELRDAAQAVLRGAELLATARDASFPMPDGPWPGTGAVLAAIETAAGRRADRVVGKPERPMYETVLDRLGRPARVLGIGDRLDSDVAGAHGAGLEAALVGVDRAPQGDRPPEHVAPTLADLVLGSSG